MDIQYGWDLNPYELEIDFKEPILLDIGRTMRHNIIKIDISLFNPSTKSQSMLGCEGCDS